MPLLLPLPSGAGGPSDVVQTPVMGHPGGLPVGASPSVWAVRLGVEWSGFSASIHRYFCSCLLSGVHGSLSQASLLLLQSKPN